MKPEIPPKILDRISKTVKSTAIKYEDLPKLKEITKTFTKAVNDIEP